MREDLHTNWAWMWGEITAGLLGRQMRRWGDIIKEHGTETPSFAALCWWPFEECLPTVWQIHLNERQFGALSSRADQSPLLGQQRRHVEGLPSPGQGPSPGATQTCLPLLSEQYPCVMAAVPPCAFGRTILPQEQEHLRLTMAAFGLEPASRAPRWLRQGWARCCTPRRASGRQCRCL